MRRHILSRANLVASGNSVNGVPYALRFHPHSFRAYQGGSVLVGIRPGRRCYLKFGLSYRALTIPHLAVAGTKRKILGFLRVAFFDLPCDVTTDAHTATRYQATWPSLRLAL